jgi:hypothetical protein
VIVDARGEEKDEREPGDECQGDELPPIHGLRSAP